MSDDRVSPMKVDSSSSGSGGSGEHNATNAWKLFDKKGNRVGTYSWDLSTRLKN